MKLMKIMKTKIKAIQTLTKQIRKCKRCELWKKRNKAVPGEGNINTKIMFIGEAPGKKEDETGKPFVGRAGKFLNQLIEKSKINRKRIYITSVLKCYTKKPTKKQIKACKPFLLKQIELIKPKIIVLLGKLAIETLLGKLDKTNKIKKIHGKKIRINKTVYLPTYHPAAGTRFPEIRRKMITDFKTLKI